MTLKLLSFDEVLQALDRLDPNGGTVPGAWSLGEAMAHCAQSIEYSVTGYPRLRSGLFRGTIGKIAKKKFLGAGSMSHDTKAPIPGAPDIPRSQSATEALSRLRRSIESFRHHQGGFAPHLAYGTCSKAEYEQLHAMHIADHLRSLRAG